MKRLADLPLPQVGQGLHAAQAALSDTKDKTWPIHRKGQPPDIFTTLNSVIFDVYSESVLIWGQEPPATSHTVVKYDWRTLRRSTMEVPIFFLRNHFDSFLVDYCRRDWFAVWDCPR